MDKVNTDTNEVIVTSLLNTEVGSFTKEHNKYSVYDISGLDYDGNVWTVEVKKRRKYFDTFYFEPQKLQRIEDKVMSDVYALCVSIDKDHYFYDFETIKQMPVIERYMNFTTANGFKDQGKKVLKQVYDIDASSYFMKL